MRSNIAYNCSRGVEIIHPQGCCACHSNRTQAHVRFQRTKHTSRALFANHLPRIGILNGSNDSTACVCGEGEEFCSHIVLFPYMNNKCLRKKDKMIAYSSIPPRTQHVLSLFQFKTPILGKWLANTALLVSMFFSSIRSVCDCYDYCSQGPGKHPTALNTYLLLYLRFFVAIQACFHIVGVI